MIAESLLTETEQALQQIREQDLPLLHQTADWQSKYRLLMQLGKKLPLLPEKIKQPEFLVKGCESRAWLLHYYDNIQDKHFFMLESDARIVKGLMAILLSLVNGMNSIELRQFDLNAAFAQLNLKPHLSQSRGNGLNAVINRIKHCTH